MAVTVSKMLDILDEMGKVYEYDSDEATVIMTRDLRNAVTRVSLQTVDNDTGVEVVMTYNVPD